MNRKDKALAEAAALLILEKNSINLEQTRGRKIDLQKRQEMISSIDEACAAGARLDKVCDIAGISPRTIQRYRLNDEVTSDGRKAAASRRTPANKISEEERSEILSVANSPQFADKPPSQIVPELADQGRYLASESSFL